MWSNFCPYKKGKFRHWHTQRGTACEDEGRDQGDTSERKANQSLPTPQEARRRIQNRSSSWSADISLWASTLHNCEALTSIVQAILFAVLCYGSLRKWMEPLTIQLRFKDHCHSLEEACVLEAWSSDLCIWEVVKPLENEPNARSLRRPWGLFSHMLPATATKHPYQKL